MTMPTDAIRVANLIAQIDRYYDDGCRRAWTGLLTADAAIDVDALVDAFAAARAEWVRLRTALVAALEDVARTGRPDALVALCDAARDRDRGAPRPM